MKNIKNNLPFDPNGRIFQWGPVPGKFLYCSVFAHVHYEYFRAKYKENWSETLWLFKNGRMFWLNDADDVEASGIKVFLKYLLPVKTRKKIYKEWQGHTRKLLEIEKQIDKTNLEKLTDKQLKKLWNNFHKTYIDFWITGSVPELANYGSEKYLHEKLKSILSNEAESANVMEILTAPTSLSFYQEEEIALYKTKNLEKHQEKYFWLKNSYAGTEILSVEFFAERKNKINKNIEEEMKVKIKETITKKKEIQKRYSLTSEIMDIAKAITDGIVWQDVRKKYILMILYCEETMLKEVARRFGYSKEELYLAWYYEIEGIFDKKNLHKKLENRKDGFGVNFFHSCKELNSKEVAFFWNTYETKADKNLTETKGMIASKGSTAKMQGVVHILLDPKIVDSFKDGEILVAPMTSPEYIFAMKKAGAVITDTGGLTSHAAIVSRELNIPCIVGAKGSTLVFKNGDVVEIDTGNGTVKLVK